MLLSRQFGIAALLTFALAVPALAQRPNANGTLSDGSGASKINCAHGAAGVWKSRMFDRLDQDHDNQVTVKEFDDARLQRFDAIDVNHNSIISQAEFESRLQGRNLQRVVMMFERIDSNGDGSVDKSEYQAIGEQRLARLDRDGNNIVTREEFLEAKFSPAQGNSPTTGAARPSSTPSESQDPK